MDAEQIITRYGDRLYRLCFIMLQNESDAEDAVQETLIQYFRKAPAFTKPEHEKAWLLKVAANKCRDMLRFRKRHSHLDISEIEAAAPEAPDHAILDALMQLPEPFRLVMVLYYVEEYPVTEIAKIIGKTPSAVKMRLQKGRKLLEEHYRKEYL